VTEEDGIFDVRRAPDLGGKELGLLCTPNKTRKERKRMPERRELQPLTHKGKNSCLIANEGRGQI